MKNWHNLKLKKRMTKILKVAAIGGVVFPLFFTTAAQAHDTLVRSTPEANQNLQEAPSSVRLQFSATPLAQGTTVAVVDSEQKDWVAGAPEITPNTVTQPLETGMPAGYYQVRGNVVSSDGHVVNVVYNFSVGDVTGKAVIPVAENLDTSSAEATDNATSSTSSSSAPAIVEKVKDSFPWWILWILIPILLALLVALWIWNRIKARKQRSRNTTVRNNAPQDNCDPPTRNDKWNN